ncbi:MAG: helix-turn-helix domain-containing protein [Thermoplasmata archaeon]
MGLWEISLRTQYDYPFIGMSGQYPGVPISMWCIWGRELLQVPTRDPEVLSSIEDDIRSFGRVVDRWMEEGSTRIFMLRCTCDDTNSPWYVWDAHEMVEEPPAIYRDGWGYFRVIGFDEAHTRSLFQDMQNRGPTELIRKRELPLTVLPSSIWVNSLFSDLTGKQIDAVVKAHRHGYYVSPRQTKTENIAAGLGVSRSTFEEHLRKAENRIIASLVPYLQLYAYGERPIAEGG